MSHYEDLAGRMDMRTDEIGKMVTNELATAIEQKQTLKDDYTRQRKSIESDIDVSPASKQIPVTGSQGSALPFAIRRMPKIAQFYSI